MKKFFSMLLLLTFAMTANAQLENSVFNSASAQKAGKVVNTFTSDWQFEVKKGKLGDRLEYREGHIVHDLGKITLVKFDVQEDHTIYHYRLKDIEVSYRKYDNGDEIVVVFYDNKSIIFSNK